METRQNDQPPAAAFRRVIGIDYSGAGTSETPLSGLRAFVAGRDAAPVEARPTPSGRRHWSRRTLATWLIERLHEDVPTLVGIDHGFSFPLAYFEKYGLSRDWPGFLADFRAHWPTDTPGVSVECVRCGVVGAGGRRMGDSRWRRPCEVRARAKSVFHFDVPGSVAKSTHAGLPWLLHIRQACAGRFVCWPFDGFDVPPGQSVLAEAYPSLWSSLFPRDGRTPDQHDAYCTAAWLARAVRTGSLGKYLHPALSAKEQEAARSEGWILGVL
jgi:hypothetical protein